MKLIYLSISFEEQYLTAVFYGFITYYAFPNEWHEKPILSLFIGICTTIAIALGMYKYVE